MTAAVFTVYVQISTNVPRPTIAPFTLRAITRRVVTRASATLVTLGMDRPVMVSI